MYLRLDCWERLKRSYRTGEAFCVSVMACVALQESPLCLTMMVLVGEVKEQKKKALFLVGIEHGYLVL